MKRILILSIGLLFAGELEVDGVIKANSGIDANNNPITNVGIPQSMSDAINGNILQDALRDDTNYEYKVFLTRLLQSGSSNNEIGYYEYQNGVNAGNESSEWSNNFHNVLIPLLTDGWKIDNVIETSTPSSSPYHQKNLYILKKPIEE